MRKIIPVLFAVSLMFACSQTKNEDQVKSSLAGTDGILASAVSIMETNEKEIVSLWEENVNYEGAPSHPDRYALYDVDEDGLEELFLMGDNDLMVFTLEDEVTPVILTGPDNIRLCGDCLVIVRDTMTSYYQIKGSSLSRVVEIAQDDEISEENRIFLESLPDEGLELDLEWMEYPR